MSAAQFRHLLDVRLIRFFFKLYDDLDRLVLNIAVLDSVRKTSQFRGNTILAGAMLSIRILRSKADASRQHQHHQADST